MALMQNFELVLPLPRPPPAASVEDAPLGVEEGAALLEYVVPEVLPEGRPETTELEPPVAASSAAAAVRGEKVVRLSCHLFGSMRAGLASRMIVRAWRHDDSDQRPVDTTWRNGTKIASKQFKATAVIELLHSTATHTRAAFALRASGGDESRPDQHWKCCRRVAAVAQSFSRAQRSVVRALPSVR